MTREIAQEILKALNTECPTIKLSDAAWTALERAAGTGGK